MDYNNEDYYAWGSSALENQLVISAIDIGLFDLLEKDLTSTAGTLSVEVVIAADGGKLQGEIVDSRGEPASGATGP